MTSRDELRALYASGQRGWSDFELGFDVFEAHCERVLAPDGLECAREHAADLYLACACAARLPLAMCILERTCSDTVRNAIVRINHDADFVQETFQEFWDKVLGGSDPRIAVYAGRGPLKAWLRATAVHHTLDRLRNRRALERRTQELDEALATASLSAETALVRQRYTAPFQRALRRAVALLSSQDRSILRMQVQGRCTIDDLARIYGCHRATAGRRLERARSKIFELLHAELSRDHAGLTPNELRSIARALGSALLVTLFDSGTGPQNDRP